MKFNIRNLRSLQSFLISVLFVSGFIWGCRVYESDVLQPVISGPWWMIGPEPDLSPFGLQPESIQGQPNQPNDHHVFQTDDGQWHLWACVRRTQAGRILCHWEGDSLIQSPWHLTGEIIRADKSAGESQVEWQNEEFLQSPYIVREKGLYYLFYGGYDTGLNAAGQPLDAAADYNHAEKQICLMTSPDGRTWTRHRDKNGFSRVFSGPGAARDPCFVKFDSLWYCYYCGHHNGDRTCGAIYVRTSRDLIHWSDWQIAQYDKTSEGKKWLPESPAVVKREGVYYLFRTHGEKGGTYVFCSQDPKNFGQGDVSSYFVTRLDVIAPEIIVDARGHEYITKIHDAEAGYGIQLAPLKWIR
jgi:hypothetical protein